VNLTSPFRISEWQCGFNDENTDPGFVDITLTLDPGNTDGTVTGCTVHNPCVHGIGFSLMNTSTGLVLTDTIPPQFNRSYTQNQIEKAIGNHSSVKYSMLDWTFSGS
jgi:hypothetical protein